MLQWRDTGDGRLEPPRTRLLAVRRAPLPPPASAGCSSSRRSSERPACATAADEATTSDISMSDADTPAVAAAGEMGVEPDVCCASKSYAYGLAPLCAPPLCDEQLAVLADGLGSFWWNVLMSNCCPKPLPPPLGL